MKHLPQSLLLAMTLLLGLGIGAGGIYVARPLMSPQTTGPVAVVAPAPPAEAPAAPAHPQPVTEPAPASAPQPSPPPARDSERALEGVKSGEFLPLEKLTALLRERFPGEVLGVKLDEDDGRVSYEFKVLTKAGRLMEIEMDPRTGRVIDVDEDDD